MSVAPMTTEDIETLWLSDFRAYARDLLRIQPMPDPNAPMALGGTKLEPLVLNDPQNLLHEIIEDIKLDGRLVRLIILKARREGVSTYKAGRDHWMTTTRFNRYAMIITHEPEASETLFQMHKRFYQHNPVWKPQTTYNNKRLLSFDTNDGKGLGSAIRVATAGKEDIGSGQAIHYLHLSEMAKWPEHTTEAIMTSVMQCVPRSLDTEVIIESTAKGVGGEFHDRYWAARYRYSVVLKNGKPHVIKEINPDSDESNEFTSLFLPWFIFKPYRKNVPPGFEPTDKELELKDAYGLEDEHLVWRRWCIANNCNGHEEIFKQEYPSNAKEAFIASGQPVFDVQQLIKLIDNAPPPKANYTVRLDGTFISDNHTGSFHVWEEPIATEQYLISADVAEGLDRNVMGRVADFSCAMVFKMSTGEQVAEWHGKVDPDHFGKVLCRIGERYCTSWLVVERNNHGNETIRSIINEEYPQGRIFAEMAREYPHKIRKRFGWLTTRTNKGDIVDNLLAEMRDGIHGLKSKWLFEEMMSFMKDGDQYEAKSGQFDDRVDAAMVGKFVLPRLKPRVRRSRRYRGKGPTAKQAPPVKAWMV